MDTLIEFLTKQNPDLTLIIGIMIFSFFVAIFHTAIFAWLFDLDFNKKLFFVFNPLIIGICALIDFRLALAVFLLIFASVFILAIIGMFAAGLRRNREDKKEIQDFYKRYKLNPPSKNIKIIGSTLLLVAVCIGFFYIGFYVILCAIALIIAIALFVPTHKSRFLKYQAILPVSKIRSLAMGLVEVEGKVKMIEPLKSPLSTKECVGFFYSIETITRDDEGRDNYSTIFSQTVSNEFFIEDETGSIKVNPAGVEFIWMGHETQDKHNSKRYTENLLKEGDQILLIGKATVDADNKPIIRYDAFRKVLAVAPSTAVINFNNNKPFWNSFIFFSCIYCLLIALVLVTPIDIQQDKITIKKPDWKILHSEVTNK